MPTTDPIALIQQAIGVCKTGLEAQTGCLVDTIEELQLSQKPQVVMLTQEGCGACARARDYYEPELQGGAIRELAVESPEGQLLAGRHEVEAFPTFIVMDAEGKYLGELES